MGTILRLLATTNVEKLLRNSFAACVSVLLLFFLYHFADRMMSSNERFTERLVTNSDTMTKTQDTISKTQEQQSSILDRIDHTTQQTSQTVAGHTEELRDIRERLPKK